MAPSSDADLEFDDFELDASAIAHIDEVESRIALNDRPTSVTPAPRAPPGQSKPWGTVLVPESPALPRAAPPRRTARTEQPGIHPRQATDISDDEFPDSAFDDSLWQSTTLDELDDIAQNVAAPTAGRSGSSSERRSDGPGRSDPLPTLSRPPSRQLSNRTFARSDSNSSASGAQYRQRNLFGEVAQPSGPGILTLSSQSTASGTRKAKRTKQWDRTAFAESGARRLTAPRPRAPAAVVEGDAQWDVAEDIEMDDLSPHGQTGAPTQALDRPLPLPPDSMKLQLDVEAARKFIYPTNMTKRDYQFNIVQRALFDNVLVALPTGLGKTFIAAVVILNFFHWYPKGKIVFVAPTRPLVAQQQVACHGICGLPWDVACEMTGNTNKTRRGNEWEEKRIFYMTPQTLDNDIRTGDVDPKDIICLVVDEAHRATGNYAYCNIVRQVQEVNPYFRILALTATPGSNAERVQEVIDNLHISLIELRTEEALDIRHYIHKKHEETIVVEMTEEFRHARELFLDIMQQNCEALVKHGLLQNADPSTLHHFRVRSIYRECKSILSRKQWLSGTINETARMAEARHYLDVFSIKMFRGRLQELIDGIKRQDSKKMKLAQVANLAASIPDQSHPKMVTTVDTILDHFSRQGDGSDSSSRVMVFCSFRECVHEIVALLNDHEAIKATPFIGQSADKQGRGFTQKQQKDVIEKFKKGIFNVIVATSIGEEGLDIGEVDLIVCYEAVKDSVRMLQRVGRTGRKKDGRIVVLMAEGPESSIWQKSKDTYKGIQQTITAGHSVTLFDDVPRLVPPSIRPVPTFEELDQPDFRPELIGSKKASAKSAAAAKEKTARRKERHADLTRNVPEGALLGFSKASRLAKGKDRMREGDDEDSGHESTSSVVEKRAMMSDDSDDEALERGLIFDPAPSRKRAQGGKGASSAAQAPIEVPGSSPVTAQSSGQKKGRRLGVRPSSLKRRRIAIASASPDDSEAEFSPPRASTSRSKSMSKDAALASPLPPSSPLSGRGSPLALGAKLPDRPHHPSSDFDVSWSLDADALGDLTQSAMQHKENIAGKDAGLDERQLSPETYRRREAHPLIARLAAEEGVDVSPDTSPAATKAPVGRAVSDSDGDENRRRASIGIAVGQSVAPDHFAVPDSQESPIVRPGRRKKARLAAVSSSPVQIQAEDGHDGRTVMGPPQLPSAKASRAMRQREDESAISPSQRLSKAAKRTTSVKGLRNSTSVSKESSGSGRAAGSRQGRESDAGKRKKPPKKTISNSPTSRAFFHMEAERDTDEERRPNHRSDSDDEGLNTDEADSSDLEHVGDFVPTQAPRGYNQMDIYRQSLFTQAAPTPFRRKTVGGFVGGRYGAPDAEAEPQTPTRSEAHFGPRFARGIPSSERSRGGEDDEEDMYSLGSFVCGDDEDIEYASDEDGLSD